MIQEISQYTIAFRRVKFESLQNMQNSYESIS